MTHIIRMVTLSIQEATRHIRHIQMVDHNGTPVDSPRTLRLLLTVLDRLGNLISLVRDEVCKDVETKLIEVVEDVSSSRAVFTILLCKVLRTILI